MYFIHAGRTNEAEATGEVDWWDRTRAENITITITITRWEACGEAAMIVHE